MYSYICLECWPLISYADGSLFRLKLCFLKLHLATSHKHLISFTVLDMSSIDIVELSSDDEYGDVDVKAVRLEPDIVQGRIQLEENKVQLAKHQKFEMRCGRQESEENRSSNAFSTGQSSSTILDQGQSPVDDTSLSSASPLCSAPLCRLFWKAGNYDEGLGAKVSLQSILLPTMISHCLLDMHVVFTDFR